MLDDLVITERLVIPGSELRWTASRASGPGGQHVNKVATKVELRFDLRANTTLPQAVKARLRAAAGARRLDGEGCVLITEQGSRSQSMNLEVARERLRALILSVRVPPKRRRPTKPTRGSQERRIRAKKQQADKKRNRRSPRDDG